MDLTAFADDVGSDRSGHHRRRRQPWGSGARCASGLGTGRTRAHRAGGDDGPLRSGDALDELDEELRAHGQRVAIPTTGTVGGALSVGASGIRRLGYGPVRDVVLQARYVSAAGEIVTAGGPTVKNVSGFDLCRLLVGSRGHVGVPRRCHPAHPPPSSARAVVLARPRPVRAPGEILRQLYRPVSVLWNGTRYWVLLEGDRRDVQETAHRVGLVPSAEPVLPTGGRWSVPPAGLGSLEGDFVAEVGVGIVHHTEPAPPRTADPAVVSLTERIKRGFDPTGRLNPGISVLDPGIEATSDGG